MPRTLDPFVELHRDDDTIVVAHLVEIVRPTAGTLRFTDAADGLVWDGQTWASRPFLSPQVTDGGGSFDAATVEFDDVDGVIRAAIAAEPGDISVEIWELWADASHIPQGTNWLFSGYLEQPIEVIGRTVLNLGPGTLPDDVLVPPLRHTQTCPYAQAGLYRGELCGFSGTEPPGETHCAGRFSDCQLRGNEERYGGTYYLPESKEYRTSHGTVNLAGHSSGRTIVNPTHDPGSTSPPVVPFTPPTSSS